MSKTTKEIVEGINGSGAKVWQVVTVRQDGSWEHIETFDTEAEAKSWLKWA